MRKYAFIVMMLFGVTAFGAGLYSGHAQAQTNGESKNQKNNTSQTENKPVGNKKVKVNQGDTLSKIAKANKSTYPRLFDANTQVKDPDVIHPGQEIRIPHPQENLKKRAIPGNYVSSPAPQATNATRASAQVSAPADSGINGGVWDRLAACESGGNWAINTGNGYYGGLQFTLSTWQSVGGSGYPHQASKAEQIKRAQILQARSGWGQWPACTAKLGLR